MWSVRRYLNSRGVRVVTCPETNEAAAVSLDALEAALTETLRLSTCSRWPERAGCDQGCLKQIATSSDGCLLRSRVTSWYEGKSCVECGRPIGQIIWHEAPPALRAPEGTSHEWSDFAPQDLPRLFATHQPLCWYCNNANELQSLQPGLIIRRDRPADGRHTIPPSTAVY